MNTVDGGQEIGSEAKLVLCTQLLLLVDSKIGRQIDDLEAEAIAFVVEESFTGQTPEEILTETFGVLDVDTPQAAAMKIREVVYEAKKRRIGELIERNPSDGSWLQGLRENIEIGHTQSVLNDRKEIPPYIGAVSPELKPSWFPTQPGRMGGHSLQTPV